MTGSTVIGLNAGMRKHLGGGCNIIYVNASPNADVTSVAVGRNPSGAIIAFDEANNQLYQHVSGTNQMTWIKLGSVQ
jgi:hypothetical protein